MGAVVRLRRRAQRQLHVLTVLLLVFGHSSLLSEGSLVVPGLRHEAYAEEGDLNIGVLVYAHRYSAASLCSDTFWRVGVERSEAVAFITRQINERQDLLPNITLGFVAVDECRKDLTALARAVYFAPNVACNSDDDQAGGGKMTSLCGDVRHYDVVGVVGPASSRQAVMVASFLSVFQIPVIGTTSTSDELSDKSRFEYFSRLVPPDYFQSEAIVSILKRFGWTYVSLIYSEGAYGENAGKVIERLAKATNICLAVSHRMSSDAEEEEYRIVVEKLSKNSKARVVILFLSPTHIEGLFAEIKSRGHRGTFLWLAGDVFMAIDHIKDNDIAAGCLYLGHPIGTVPGFFEYYKSLSWRNTSNPWMKELWMEAFACRWDPPTNASDSCHGYQYLWEDDDVAVSWTLSKTVEGVQVFAQALHNLITAECPQAFAKKSLVRACVTGRLLLRHLRNTTLNGYAGKIAFDNKGDMLGKYWVYNVQLDPTSGKLQKVVVGEWDKFADQLVIDSSKIAWMQLNTSRASQHEDGNVSEIESVCSKACLPGHYYHQLEQPCCWECRRCRENERILNNTGCVPCERFTWPDSRATACVPIQRSYIRWTDPIALALVSLAFLGLLLTVVVGAIYVRHRNSRLIKASGKELSAVTLVGVVLATLTVVTFVAEPTDSVCLVRKVGFHVGVNLIYGPLMLKTCRIYRLFASGKKGISKPRFTSSTAMMAQTSLIVFLQVLLIVVVEIVMPSAASPRQPIWTDAYVETTCVQSPWSLLVPLCLNLLLLVVCAVMGFLARKLPANFNESMHIFVSVSTTVFMWVVFLPTYFTTFYAYNQAALLGFCLVLNVYVTLGGQFLPKLYAIYFVDENQITIAAGPPSNSGNRVGPSGVSSVPHTSSSAPRSVQLNPSTMPTVQ